MGRGRGGGGKRQTDIGTGVWKETDRETDRHRDRGVERDRQRDRQT